MNGYGDMDGGEPSVKAISKKKCLNACVKRDGCAAVVWWHDKKNCFHKNTRPGNLADLGPNVSTFVMQAAEVAKVDFCGIKEEFNLHGSYRCTSA